MRIKRIKFDLKAILELDDETKQGIIDGSLSLAVFRPGEIELIEKLAGVLSSDELEALYSGEAQFILEPAES